MAKNVEIYNLTDINNVYGFFDEALTRNDITKQLPELQRTRTGLKGTLSLKDSFDIANSDIMLDYNNIQVSTSDIVKSAGIAANSNAGTWTALKGLAAGVGILGGAPVAVPVIGMLATSMFADGWELSRAFKSAESTDQFWKRFISNLEESKNEDGFFSEFFEKFHTAQSFNKSAQPVYEDIYGEDISNVGGTLGELVGSMSQMIGFSLVGGTNGFIGGYAFQRAMDTATEQYGVTDNGKASIKAGVAAGLSSAITGATFMKLLPYVSKVMTARNIDHVVGTEAFAGQKGLVSTALGKGTLPGTTNIVPETTRTMFNAPLASYASGGIEMAGWIATEEGLESFISGKEYRFDPINLSVGFAMGMGMTYGTRKYMSLKAKAERERLLNEKKEPIATATTEAQPVTTETTASKVIDVNDEEIFTIGKEHMDIDDVTKFASAHGREVLANTINDVERANIIHGKLREIGKDNDINFAKVTSEMGELFPLSGMKKNPLGETLTPTVDRIAKGTEMTADAKKYMEETILRAPEKHAWKAQAQARIVIAEAKSVAGKLKEQGIGDGTITEPIMRTIEFTKKLLGKDTDKMSYAAKELFVEKFTKAASEGYGTKEMNKIIANLKRKLATSKKNGVGVGDIDAMF